MVSNETFLRTCESRATLINIKKNKIDHNGAAGNNVIASG